MNDLPSDRLTLVQANQAWRQRRHEELASPDSWLGLLGLFWLQPGPNVVGSGDDCQVRLPTGPARWGVLHHDPDGLRWQPDGGASIFLDTDKAGAPSTVDRENLGFFVVDRDNRLALRLRDRDWAAKAPFAGLDYFEFDPAWQIVADWLPLTPPLSMTVPNVSGDLKPVEVAWQARFSVAGQVLSLLPMVVNEDEVFFVFRDRSSGKETYGAGRFLKARPAVDGKILLDFNRAYSPPCAFTPFATCPLPPPENWLPLAVTAGEKVWKKPAG
jgi:uncharacterized protein